MILSKKRKVSKTESTGSSNGSESSANILLPVKITDLGLKWSVYALSQLATPVKSNVTNTKSEDLTSPQVIGGFKIGNDKILTAF